MSDAYDEDGWVEDMDFLVWLGLDRPQIAERMGVGYECLEGRIRRAISARKMERIEDPRRPAGVTATRAFLLAIP